MKIRQVIMIAVLTIGSFGCAHVSVVAPYGQEVYLVSSEEKLPVERRWRTWYLVWGLSPLDNTMPVEYIQREQLNEVRVVVEDNIPDALHAILYNVAISVGLIPQTIIVEGNRLPSKVTSSVAP
jgi:hypothetical protein